MAFFFTSLPAFLSESEAAPTLPPVFYHATPAANLSSIEANGLVPSRASRPESVPGIYLSDELGVSQSYCEMGHGVDVSMPVEWVIFAIDSQHLNPNAFQPDEGVESENHWDDYATHGYVYGACELEELPYTTPGKWSTRGTFPSPPCAKSSG